MLQAFTFVAEPGAMIHKRLPGAGLLAFGALTLTALTGGCGGSTTKATPLVTPTTTSSPTTTAKTKPTGSGTTAGHAPASGPTGASGTQTTAAQLALANQELSQAGVSLAGSDRAINGADVNQAKLQEGSAP
jgi:hypothetical protein